MKKQLLLGTALLAAVSAFPQTSGATGGKKRIIAEHNLADRLSSKYAAYNPVENGPGVNTNPVQGPAYQASTSGNDASKSSAAISWNLLSGSMNIYGMLVNNTKPLRYYPGLDAVSFIHRKSQTYVPSVVHTATASQSGVIVAAVSSGIYGSTWDSTCVWNDANNWARYPQGGIYNTPGNNNLSQAYVIVTGPVTSQASSWVGSYLASKSLSTYNNAASSASNAQQFIPNTPPYGNTGKVDFPRYDFSVTDDGVVRAIGTINNNINGTGAAYGLRGARVIKAQFNSGTLTFDWTGDSIIPPAATNVNGVALWGTPHMCWNKSGTVGYVWFIGLRTGATNSNYGYQPIIFKTTDSGNNWNEIPGINFNSTSGMFTNLLARLDTVPGTNYKAPQFNVNEGMDGIVDANNKLHIVSTIISTIKSHEDSLLYYRTYGNADGETYRYEYENDRLPYIYDFTEGTTPGQWSVTEIDAMSTEGPGERPGDAGFGANPWDATGGSGSTDKVSSDARIQLSRSDDGRYIIYSWAESDINVTASGFRWNSIPNIKARAVEVISVGTGTNLATFNALSPTKINVSDPASGGNVLVKDNAQMFYMSPRAKVTATAAENYTLTCPYTVSNSQPLTQLLPNRHWYTGADLAFKKYGVGISENAQSSVNNSVIYPNPASGNAYVSINLKDNSKVDVKVISLVGAVVKTSSVEGQAGDNNVNIDLSGLSSGIYMVNVRVGEVSATKKIIVQ